MAERSRTFGPVVVASLAGGVLTAVAGTRPWVTVNGTAANDPLLDVAGGTSGAQMPLATTLALVVLAAWGVVLVTRGRVRRAVTVLGALAAAGVLATVVSGWWLVPDSLRETLTDAPPFTTSVSPWYAVALLSAAVAAVACGAAVVLVGGWPEMGTRYDTPTGSDGVPTERDEASSLDLWKAQDQGRDPTA
ncbi:MAG: Trp biosynthesis-associated membrane protein [Nocardioides sp.]